MANEHQYFDSMLVQKQIEIDSLNRLIQLQKIVIARVEKENDLNKEINNKLRGQLTNEKTRTDLFRERLRLSNNKVKWRTVFLVISASGNLVFIIKSLK